MRLVCNEDDDARFFSCQPLWCSSPKPCPLAGCASNDTSEEEDDEFAGVQERELYELARTALDSNRYPIAIERLEALDTRYPFGAHAEQAQLELIYAYYENSEWEEARAAASRFIRLHPDHPQVDYAYYLRGLSAWQAGRFSLERLRLIDISKRDLGASRDAYNDFRELIQRYPQSEYAADSQQRIVYLRELLARHELHVADYYLRRGLIWRLLSVAAGSSKTIQNPALPVMHWPLW
ncbi:hypothetical protein HSBAA_55140 [Vreelandella sulfidaeris]|uniref:Outer membrane protein assembly factor BamD n=1 Tax=Vreelandella sulfidaeris TaxID=115553 RepID=A0A455UIM3_9GAMM|nr:hypothetical protein HSBAA_55140 [Halomonas sulfidaeris]